MIYETYEELDELLGMLHAPSLEGPETLSLGPFAVFQGFEPKIKPRKKRKDRSKGPLKKDIINKKQKINTDISTSPENSLSATPFSDMPSNSPNQTTEPLDSQQVSPVSDKHNASLDAPHSHQDLFNISLDNQNLEINRISDDPLQQILHLDIELDRLYNDNYNTHKISSPNRNTVLPTTTSAADENINMTSTSESSGMSIPAIDNDSVIQDTNMGLLAGHSPSSQSWVNNIGSLLSTLDPSSRMINTENSNSLTAESLNSNSNSDSNSNQKISGFKLNTNHTLGSLSPFPSINTPNILHQLDRDFLNHLSSFSNSKNLNLNTPSHYDLFNNYNLDNNRIDHNNNDNSNNSTVDNNSSDLAGVPECIMQITMGSPSLGSDFLNIDSSTGFSLNAIQLGTEGRYLLHHYINNLTELMTVFAMKKNPWKLIYFPGAIKGVGELVSLGKTNPARNGLLYALMSVSAFNLQSRHSLTNSELMKHYGNLGSILRSQALKYLKQIKLSDAESMDYNEILSAALSMVTIDVTRGANKDCYNHLLACEEFVQRRLQTKKPLSPSSITLHRIFSFLKMMQESTLVRVCQFKIDTNAFDEVDDENELNKNISYDSNHKRRPKIELLDGSVDGEDDNNNDDFSKYDITMKMVNVETTVPNKVSSFRYLDLTTYNFTQRANDEEQDSQDYDILSTDTLYSLPNSFILLFNEITKLVKYAIYFRSIGTRPKKFSKKCTEIESKLMKWRMDARSFQNGNKEKEDKIVDDDFDFAHSNERVVYYNTMAFYNALVIYYFRLVREVNPSILQTNVEKTLKYLLKINEMVDSGVVSVVPLLWASFIAGCDALDEDLQKQFRELYAYLAVHGVGLFLEPRRVVEEVWKRRRENEDEDKVNWMSVVKDWNTNVMLM